jgi:Phage portal protein
MRNQLELAGGVPMNWTSPPNIFGSFGGLNMPDTNVGFIPVNGEGDVLLLNELLKDGAIWRNLQTKHQQYWAYLFCSPLASVIDRQTNADLNGDIEILLDDGNYDTSRYAKAVKNRMFAPNPVQDWYEFRAQQMVYKKTYGYALVYTMELASSPDNSFNYLWNLNPLFCEPIPNNEFSFVKSPNIIKEWNVSAFNFNATITSEKILILKDGYMEQRDHLGLPVSKIAGLEWAISNICAAMEADNVLLRKKGPLGFISQDSSKDPVAGYVPLSPKEKVEVQTDLQQYGLSWSQWQYVVTRHGLKWNPMSFNVKDLDTKGTIREGIDMICDRFGYPAELMSGKNATYENRTSSERWLINNVTIPENKRDMLKYSLYYDLNISEDYSEMPVQQDAVLANGEGLKYRTEALDLQYKSGIITKNDYLKALDMDTVDDGDTYYEPPKPPKPAALPAPVKN